jgi:carbon monoxide dehydrogenase subunit G
MQLEHSFTVPAPVEEAWRVLLDVERVAPCLPGATLDSSEGGTYAGRVKVKVGPIQITYAGKAEFTETDEVARRAVMSASGREARGSGTARATITMTMRGEGEKTFVQVLTDLAVTGRPAQFGRGVMADVGERLIGRFADCLSRLFEEPPAPETSMPAGAGVSAATTAPSREAASFGDNEPVDLLQVGSLPVLKRLAPVALLLAALAVVWLVLRRRRG